jgi:hypothetical protein
MGTCLAILLLRKYIVLETPPPLRGPPWWAMAAAGRLQRTRQAALYFAEAEWPLKELLRGRALLTPGKPLRCASTLAAEGRRETDGLVLELRGAGLACVHRHNTVGAVGIVPARASSLDYSCASKRQIKAAAISHMGDEKFGRVTDLSGLGANGESEP